MSEQFCGSLGPFAFDLECELPEGHEGQHEAGLNSELYEWENHEEE